MPSPRFVPFSGDRFDARSNGSDVSHGSAQNGGEENQYKWYRFQPPHHPPIAHSEVRPTSQLQALMEARPGVEPERAVEEDFILRDMVDTFLGELSDRERYVIEALFFERLSLRELGRRLSVSKDTVVNVRNAALQKMRDRITDGLL